MRTYRVQGNIRSYVASIEQKSERECRVMINDAVMECTCNRPEEIATWAITRDGEKIHAKSRLLGSDKVEVWVGGSPFQFTVTHVGPGEIGGSAKPISRMASGEIRASMPGRVTSILMKLGEEVSVGTPFDT